MILFGNLPRVCERAQSSQRVLDVGGRDCPFNLATHVLDVMPYETRQVRDALDPEHTERFSKETWTVHDACATPWPFPDKMFDFVFCSHLLEDVRDPIAVCREMIRVGRAGYLETPSRSREIFSKSRFFSLRSFLGAIPEVGFFHHRWFVEIEGTHVRFTAKDQRFMLSKDNYITRADLGRKMTDEESGIGLFWSDAFTVEESFLSGRRDPSLRTFRNNALCKLKKKK